MDAQEAEVPTDEQVAEAVATLKLVADSTRLRILWALSHGEHSVNRLAQHVGAQPAAVSQHLAKLRLGHLVRTRREGTSIFYLAQNDHVRRIVEEALFHADHVVHGLADHDERRPSPRRIPRRAEPA
ncbi:MAG: metalloregulator ArsR/SmtB family transcription factor [Actinomycetota bacterium]|nr:metalloregulator ArsR/SmtB family transcription factor [Actinomycetota bacterium]